MPFKIAFLAAFVVAVAVASTATRRATQQHGGSKNQLAHEIRALIVVRATLGLIFYTALIGWLFNVRMLAWTNVPVPTPLRWLGVALLVPTLAFFAWSYRSLDANYRGGVGLHDAHVLVTTGPYALLRHPIYVTFIAIMLLVFVLSANWVLGLSGLLLVIGVALARIPVEERELAERFGAAWTSYRGRTGVVLPRLRR